MKYTISLLESEISRLERRLTEERGYLKSSLEYAEKHTEAIELFESTLAELVLALSRIETASD